MSVLFVMGHQCDWGPRVKSHSWSLIYFQPASPHLGAFRLRQIPSFAVKPFVPVLFCHRIFVSVITRSQMPTASTLNCQHKYLTSICSLKGQGLVIGLWRRAQHRHGYSTLSAEVNGNTAGLQVMLVILLLLRQHLFADLHKSLCVCRLMCVTPVCCWHSIESSN